MQGAHIYLAEELEEQRVAKNPGNRHAQEKGVRIAFQKSCIKGQRTKKRHHFIPSGCLVSSARLSNI